MNTKTRYRVNRPNVISETIDGEAVIINLGTGTYYSLDRVAGVVWAFLEASLPGEEIVKELARHYDGDSDHMRREVEALMKRLSDEALIVPCADGEPVNTVALEPPVAGREPFRPPVLEVFTDMQDLILLDPVHEVDSRGWPHRAGQDGHDS
jgi:hypothetical protein